MAVNIKASTIMTKPAYGGEKGYLRTRVPFFKGVHA